MYMYVQYMQRCVCVFVGESPQVKEEWFHRVEAFGYEEFADLRYAFSFSTVKASELVQHNLGCHLINILCSIILCVHTPYLYLFVILHS